MYVVVVWLCVLAASAASRILVALPAASTTTAVLGDSLVNVLLDAGHQVTYVRPFSSLAPGAGLTSVDTGSIADTFADGEHDKLIELVRSPQPPQRALESGASLLHRTLQHSAVRELLMDTDNAFDLVIAEWYYSALLAPLASLYECPLVWYSTVDATWMNLQLVHGQSNPAYSVDPLARRQASSNSFRDRLDRLRQQVYLTAWNYYTMYFIEATAYMEIFRTPLQVRAHYPPNYEEVVYNGSMLLIDSHPLLGQSMPLPQNTKYIGGHHIEPTKRLPESLQKFLDSRSKNGLILFSLGASIKSRHLPDYMKRQLLDVFGELEQTVLWEFEEPLPHTPHNVHIVKKVLPSTILNHPNTVLFITNGGSVSVMEAAYFGVPIIGIPIHDEQFLKMDLVMSRGLGVRVGFTEYLAHKLKDAVKEVLGNSSYRINARKASDVIRSPLVAPKRELLYWIELSLSHRAEHLRSAALQLSTLERLHLDLVAVSAMFLWFLTKVWKVIKVHWNSDDEHDKKNK